MSDKIELLSEDNGRAVEGRLYADSGPQLRYLKPQRLVLCGPESDRVKVYYADKREFGLFDERGIPQLVRLFYVPAEMDDETSTRLARERLGIPPDEPELEPVEESEWEPIGWEHHIRAYIWWCGDEVCDCHQPKITAYSPNLLAGEPWYELHTLWEGEFKSEPSFEEMEEQKAQLEDACRRYGLLLGANPGFRRYLR